MTKIVSVILFIFVIFLFVLLSFFEDKIKFENKKRIMLYSSFFISIIGAFRAFGSDLENYREIFENINLVLNFDYFSNMLEYRIEPIFMIMISLIKSLGLGFKTFLFLSLIIPMLIIYFIIVKTESDLVITTFALFLFIYLFSVDILRHFLAASIYLSALYSLAYNKKINFYLKSFISIFAHYSNIIVIFLRPFLKIKWSNIKYILTVITVCMFGIIVKNAVFDFFASQSFENTILVRFQSYLLYYDESYIYHSTLHSVLLFLIQYGKVFFYITIIFLAMKYKELQKNKFNKVLLSSQIIGSIILFICIMYDSTQMGLRLNFLLSIGSFILLKEVLFKYYKGNKTLPFIFLIIFLSFNILIRVLYNIGIHNPSSQFYLF